MPNSHTEVYVHFVWATWDRKPLISPDAELSLYSCIRTRCRDMQAHLFAIGGTANHIHLLIRLPSLLSLSQVAKDIKGASSHFMTPAQYRSDFRWQGSFSAFGVCRDALETACQYIEHQKEHHACKTTQAEWELDLGNELPG